MSVGSETARNKPVAAPRYQPLVLVLVAMCGGILADYFISASLLAWWTIGAIAWLTWVWCWLRQSTRWGSAALLLAIGGAGAAWHHSRWHDFPTDDLGRFAREQRAPICLEAVALTGPRWSPPAPADPLSRLPRTDETEIQLRVTRARDGATWRDVSGAVRLTVAGRLTDVRAGDRLRVLADLEAPAAPRNPGEFDYGRYLRTHRQLCELHSRFAPCVSVQSRGSPWNYRRWLGDLRQHGSDLFWRYLRPERAGLASAVLLGSREQVDRQRTQSFFTTGTVHLLAISGLHVGILAYGFWWLLRMGWSSRRWTLGAAMVFVVLYALLTDARPPVTRAAILIVFFCSARIFGRPALSFNTLAFAAIFILMLNPVQLFQTGTQLSFLAVATLACCRPLWAHDAVADPLKRLIQATRPWPVRVVRRLGRGFGRLWLTSALIWLVAVPLVLLRFNIVTPVAAVLNPLLMIPIAIALFAGFGVLVWGSLVPPLGQLCGRVCDTSFAAIESCIHTSQSIPSSHVWLPAPARWWVLAFYVALGLFAAFPRLRPPKRWAVAVGIAWVGLGVATLPQQRAAGASGPRPLGCTFISVGHGTSVLVELPGGQTLLYDAGRDGTPATGARMIAEVLWSRGVTHLDAVILSHADGDHYNALPGLLERISVGVVYVSPVMFDDQTEPLGA